MACKEHVEFCAHEHLQQESVPAQDRHGFLNQANHLFFWNLSKSASSSLGTGLTVSDVGMMSECAYAGRLMRIQNPHAAWRCVAFWIQIWPQQQEGTMRCFAKSLNITINMPYNMANSHATTNIMDLPHNTSHLLPARPINSHIHGSLLSFYVHLNFHARGPTAKVTPPMFMQTVPCFHFHVSFFVNASTPEVISSRAP